MACVYLTDLAHQDDIKCDVDLHPFLAMVAFRTNCMYSEQGFSIGG